MKHAVLMLSLFFATTSVVTTSTLAQDDLAQTLITNVNIFDGRSDQLAVGMDVLVEGNLVEEIGEGLQASSGATVIDGGGRTLMPGLLDSHVHLMLTDHPHVSIYERSWAYVGAKAAAGAKAMLLRGFTTVRDVGGPVGGLKKAIDEGLVEGPRVLPSGPYISQTSGHADLETSEYKLSPYFTGIPDKAEILGWGFIADGVPEVQKAAREALRTGATQLKVMAGGGVSSFYDPLHTTQYTKEELAAIVTEAAHWGTYVAVHAYTDAAVRQCIEAGVMSIEHAPFLTEKTLKLMAEEGVWMSPQAYLFGMTPEELNIVDLFGPLEKQALQPLEFKARAKFFSNLEILRQATSLNAELFELSGELHPYQEGPLGVIEEGAYADLIVVDGNPLDDIEIMTDPRRNFLLIMKDGVIYKNELPKK
jgi:imidazolonepropionase-like amidohydrolase